MQTSHAAALPESAPLPANLAPKRAPLLKPGWPIAAIYLAFPLWWVLGFRSFSFLFAAVAMAIWLLRRPRVSAPRGFGLWLLFLATVVASAGVLFAAAPLSVPGGGHLLTYSYRLAWYLTLTITLLYIGNLPEEQVSTTKITRWLSVMFVVTVCGGWLGMITPTFQFESLLERLLPAGLAGNTFIRSITHPVAAQIQDVLGFVEARPAAPFSHTNDWGANLGLLLPFFVFAWWSKDAGWRRYAAPFVLLAALVPVVYSLNRGLWLGLTAMALVVALKMAAANHFWGLGLIVVGLGLVILAVVATPLGTVVQQRFDHGHSNDARSSLATLTVESMAEGSPVIGFGSTRNVPGNFNSIAGGATDECRRCSPPAMGTQGHAWLVIFSQGIAGFVLFTGFLAYRFFVSWRNPAPIAVAGVCMLVFLGVTVWFYDLLEAPLFTVMVGLGLMWRAERHRHAARPEPAGVVWSET